MHKCHQCSYLLCTQSVSNFSFDAKIMRKLLHFFPRPSLPNDYIISPVMLHRRVQIWHYCSKFRTPEKFESIPHFGFYLHLHHPDVLSAKLFVNCVRKSFKEYENLYLFLNNVSNNSAGYV